MREGAGADGERERSFSIQRGLWTREARAVSQAESREVTRDGYDSSLHRSWRNRSGLDSWERRG